MVCWVGELEALLAKVNVAEVAPLACGVKVTLKEADCPAARVTGSEIPESTNSALFRLAELTVTEAPLAVRLPPSDAFAPTTTLPKLKLAGETASCPGVVPVPLSAIFSVELEAFEMTARFPLAAPPADGVKVAVNVTL